MAAEILSQLSRVALYARVSTVNHNQDPEMQLSELREYASRRGWKITEEYLDHGVSGSKESRPALNKLMELNALSGCCNKDRNQRSEELCDPEHVRLDTKPSSCGREVTVYVSSARDSCTFSSADGFFAEHRKIEPKISFNQGIMRRL